MIYSGYEDYEGVQLKYPSRKYLYLLLKQLLIKVEDQESALEIILNYISRMRKMLQTLAEFSPSENKYALLLMSLEYLLSKIENSLKFTSSSVQNSRMYALLRQLDTTLNMSNSDIDEILGNFLSVAYWEVYAIGGDPGGTADELVFKSIIEVLDRYIKGLSHDVEDLIMLLVLKTLLILRFKQIHYDYYWDDIVLLNITLRDLLLLIRHIWCIKP